MYPHFQKVFNNHRQVDNSVLEIVKQQIIEWEHNNSVVWKEFDRVVNKLKNGKAAGLNGVPPEAFKAITAECRTKIFRYVQEFSERKTDYDGWHQSQ